MGFADDLSFKCTFYSLWYSQNEIISQWFHFIHDYPWLPSGGLELALPKPALDGTEGSFFGK